MMLKKQFLLFLLIGAFSLHLAHQLFPHHHHEEEVAATHSHEPGSKHHHHHDTPSSSKEGKQTDLLDEILSFINHGKTDNPIQSGNQLKADFCKTISIILPGFSGIQDFSLFSYHPLRPVETPPDDHPKTHDIIFTRRRGPPAMA
jgi:hypothetical protein